jgi:hypothetical protein
VGVGYDEDNGRGGQSDAGRFGAGAGGRRHDAAAAAAASKGPPPWQTVLVSATVTGKVAALAKRLLGGATLVSIDAASAPSQVMAEMGVCWLVGCVVVRDRVCGRRATRLRDSRCCCSRAARARPGCVVARRPAARRCCVLFNWHSEDHLFESQSVSQPM